MSPKSMSPNDSRMATFLTSNRSRHLAESRQVPEEEPLIDANER